MAEKWAKQLAGEIEDGKFADQRDAWVKDLDFQNATETAMAWSREANAYVCTHGTYTWPAQQDALPSS